MLKNSAYSSAADESIAIQDTDEDMVSSSGTTSRLKTRITPASNSSSKPSCSSTGVHGKARDKGQRHVLPPCKVCGAPARGFHYGVNTCEACKGFFRRSIVKGGKYDCLKNERCKLEPGQRGVCGYCRYQRCLKAGMSVEGIRIGRYTNEKKSQDIKEVRLLASSESASPDEEMPDSDLSVTENASESINEPKVSLIGDECKPASSFPSSEELLDIVIDAQKRYFPETVQMKEDSGGIVESENQYKKEKDIYQSIFGLSSYVNSSEFTEVYSKTGIELDPRLQTAAWWLPVIAHGIKKQVAFVKALPGFKLLPVCDQINLIKNSMSDIWIVSRHFAFNRSLGTFSAFTDTMSAKTFDVCSLMGDFLGNQVLKVAYKMQKLDLNAEVIYALKTFAVFAPGFCQVTEREKLEELHSHYLELLMYALRKHHSSKCMIVFAGIVEVLTELRTVSHYLGDLLQKTPLTLISKDHIPQLLLEILSASVDS